jgi:hypothetical protein
VSNVPLGEGDPVAAVKSVVSLVNVLSSDVEASKHHGADPVMIPVTTVATASAASSVASLAVSVAMAMGVSEAIGNAIPIPLLGAAIGAIVGAFVSLGLWLTSAGRQPDTYKIASTPEEARRLLTIFRIDPTFLFRFWDQVGRSQIDPANPDQWPAGTVMVDPAGSLWTKQDNARWRVTGKAPPGVPTMPDPFDAARASNPAAPPYGWLDTEEKPHFGGRLLAAQPGGWGPALDETKLSPAHLAERWAWVFSQIVIMIRELRAAAGDCSPTMQSAGVNCTPWSDKTAKTPLGNPVTVFDSWYWDPFKGNQALGRQVADPLESYVFYANPDVDEPLTSIHHLAALYYVWIRNKNAPPEVHSPRAAHQALNILREGLKKGLVYDSPGGSQKIVFDQAFVDELKNLRWIAGEKGPDMKLSEIVGGADLTPMPPPPEKIVARHPAPVSRFQSSPHVAGLTPREDVFNALRVAGVVS